MNSLKRTKNLSKALSKTNSSFKTFSRGSSSEDAKILALPPVSRKLYLKEILKPTSILTRYLERQTHQFLKETEEEMKKPIKINLNVKNIKQKNEEDTGDNKEEKEESEVNNKKGIKYMSKTERGRGKDKQKNNKFDKKLLYLTETRDMRKKNKSVASKKTTSVESSSKKILELKQDTSDNDLFHYQRTENIPDAISAEKELPLQKMKRLDKFFRRLKSYQPKIYTDWKTKNGLSITIGSICSPSPMINDIIYQSTTLRDQQKLLEDNYLYYKTKIVIKNNYLESFRSLSLINKINYNKALEETIGILLLLPQLILADFYKLIQKFENISVPKKEKFEEKYIFNEIENLFYNNNLLTEVFEFFQNCFEVYLLLINEVDDMSLKPKNFNNVLTSFEKARYNICYVINSSQNAMSIYNKDLKSINKFNKNLGITNKTLENSNLYDRMMNQFYFKKNAERQRKLRIEACLNYRKEEEENELIFTGNSDKNKIIQRNKFNSIIDSDLVTQLLKNCIDEAKNRITTERINNEIDGEHGEEGQNLKNNKREVIKLNF